MRPLNACLFLCSLLTVLMSGTAHGGLSAQQVRENNLRHANHVLTEKYKKVLEEKGLSLPQADPNAPFQPSISKETAKDIMSPEDYAHYAAVDTQWRILKGELDSR